MNFCISANSLTKKYECKTTHSATPFLKVDTQYLDLTTKTTSGLNIKVKHNNMTYRPLQTATSTSSRSSQYISTSGYSGISSSANYTGLVSSTKNISSTTGYQYYDYTATLNNPINGAGQYTWTYSLYSLSSKTKTTYAHSNYFNTQTITMRMWGGATKPTNTAASTRQTGSLVVSNTNNIVNSIINLRAYSGGKFIQGLKSITINLTNGPTASIRGTYSYDAIYVSCFNYMSIAYTGVGKALTKMSTSSCYITKTSAQSNGMVSVTSTKILYTTTTGVINNNLSSITALTKTTSRTSQYETITEI